VLQMTRDGIENGFEHRGAEAVGLRIISAAMIAIEERKAFRQRMYGAMREGILGELEASGDQNGPMRDRA